MQPKEGFLRPVFIFADEFQNFVTSHDAVYQSVARSAGGCSLYLTQNRENLRRVLKNDDAVDSFAKQLATKAFFSEYGSHQQMGQRDHGRTLAENHQHKCWDSPAPRPFCPMNNI